VLNTTASRGRTHNGFKGILATGRAGWKNVSEASELFSTETVKPEIIICCHGNSFDNILEPLISFHNNPDWLTGQKVTKYVEMIISRFMS